jgi:hypothetical protein
LNGIAPKRNVGNFRPKFNRFQSLKPKFFRRSAGACPPPGDPPHFGF